MVGDFPGCMYRFALGNGAETKAPTYWTWTQQSENFGVCSLEVKFKYRSQKVHKAVQRQVRPLGILFGKFTYIAASTGNRAPIAYGADLITDLEAQTSILPRKTSLVSKIGWQKVFAFFAVMLFGILSWEFRKRLLIEQKKLSSNHRRGGTLVVELKCRGHCELIHELLHPDWLGYVKIESPERIKEEYSEQLERAKLAF